MKPSITKLYTLFFILIYAHLSNAQVLTKEDSLSAGLTARGNSYSVLSGYGEMAASYDLRWKTGTANLTRNVLFFGHRFNSKIFFFSELELENAKVAAGSPGEFSMEQMFLKFNANPSNYFVAGLFIPRIGLINENHLPTTFNGNDRPTVERLVIPSTWREIGIGYYGASRAVRGLNYSVALLNGLNNKNFALGSGIRKGRMAGAYAPASNIALTGALLYYTGNFRIQYSLYYGGSSGLDEIESDSLGLGMGLFANPVMLNEASVRYHSRLFEGKALGAIIHIRDAEAINKVYKSNTPSALYGAYVEAGLHLLEFFKPNNSRELTLFSRVETMDLNHKIPGNTSRDGFQKKLIITTGLTFFPTKGVALKLDHVWRKTDNYNQAFYKTNPLSSTRPFNTVSNFINIGLGFSF